MGDIESLPPEESFRLREYLRALRVRKWSVLLITILATGAAFLYGRQQTPVFRSEARVLATNPLSDFQTANSLAPPNMDTERALVGSTEVTKCASQLLGASTLPPTGGPGATPTGGGGATPSPSGSPGATPSPVPGEGQTGGGAVDATPATLCTAELLGQVDIPPGLRQGLAVSVATNTNILVVSYSDPRPKVAQLSAQAFADAYVHYKTVQASEAIADDRAVPLAQEAELIERQTQLNNEIADINSSGGNPAAKQSELNSVNTRLAQISATLLGLDPARINPPFVTLEAAVPPKPATPNKPLITAVGLFVGLSFGAGLALLRERLDDRLRGRADLEASLGAPVLAVVPRVPGWRRKDDAKLVTLDEPKSSVAEAYRTLRTSILFTAVQRGMKTMMVVSPLAGEGKTTTACNLAVSLADANRRVILLSADLRKPRLHRFFGLDNEKGLANVLAGEVKPWEALQNPKVENLRVMSSGPVPGRPAELLQSEQMGELLAELRDVADLIILDTAPVLLVADALGLAPLCDGVLCVADAEGTSTGAVAHAREVMEQVAAPLIGSVLNNFDPAKARDYGYAYGYGGYRYRYGAAYGGGTYGQAYDGETRRSRARSRSSRGE